MLSFDITDRNIRVIKGSESNGKIRINAAATLELEEGVINNGHVKDVPRLATIVNKMLKTHKMADKEACVSISSNLVIFKELKIKKTDRNGSMTKLVGEEMRAQMSLDSSYSISYVIVGKDEDDPSLTVVLATACPFEIIECYSKVCAMLQLQLKSAIISCNCATKVLLSDKKNEGKMPLFAVQVDKTFISINMYDGNQLLFTRFASISAEDYGNSADYVFEAVQENIDRMLQFQKFTSPDRPVQNVIFYGDTKDYIRYVKMLDEDYGIQASTITAPPNIHGYENLEFSQYVNAIGALFSRDKTKEWVNLLEVDSVNTSKLKAPKIFAASYIITMVLLLGGVGAWSTILFLDKSEIQKDIDKKNDYINSEETQSKLAEFDAVNVKIEKISGYANALQGAIDAYDTYPHLRAEDYTIIENTIKEIADQVGLDTDPEKIYLDVWSEVVNGSSVQITNPDFSDNTITFSVTALEPANPLYEDTPDFPRLLMAKFRENPRFIDAAYTGYSIETYRQEGSASINLREVKFDVELKLSAVVPKNLETYLTQAPEQTEEGGKK